MSKFGIPVRNGVSVGITAGVGTNSLNALAQAILRSFYPNSSSYPFATRQGAYQDTGATTPAVAINDPIGLQQDMVGTNNATQATAINRPTLQQDAGGRFYGSFDGSNDSLALTSVPFRMADDHAIVICFSLPDATLAQGVVTPGFGVNSFIASVIADTTNGISVRYANDTPTYFTRIVGTIAVGEVVVVGIHCIAGVVTAWKNLTPVSTLSPTGAFTLTGSVIGDNPGFVKAKVAIYDYDPIKGAVTDAQMLTLIKAAGLRAGLVI